jgi:protein-S-isoprenylcysteine O-methyltransferase Ste14
MMLILKNLLFTVFVPGTVAVYVPWLLTRGRPPGGGAFLAVAAALFGAGVAIYTWCVWDFASFGRGTPAPIDAPKKLVVRGLYRHMRNPMYVGVLATILGWAALYRAGSVLAYALAIGAAFHLFVVAYEEPTLRRVFGADYEEYCRRVHRWLPTFGLPR